MKRSLLDHLRCPVSGAPLRLEVFETDGDEVIAGRLDADGGSYPVIRGVPRMLPPDLQPGLVDDYPEFYERYPEMRPDKQDRDRQAIVQRQTQEAFGYEWTWADDYDADNYYDWFPEGVTAPDLFEGKTGIEVGCGAGRHAEITSTKSALHFAVDLSIAVDSAYARLRDKPNVHVIQADAFRLPFAERSVDYLYCIGVLQHMHDPPAGFRSLSRYPKPGGELIVNVYQKGRLSVELLSLFRRFVLLFSNENIRRISVFCGLIDYYGFIYPWKLVRDTAFGRAIARFVPERIREYARHSSDTCIVDWFDRLSCPVKQHYRAEELAAWYRAEGYGGVVVSPYWKAFWNGYGRLERGGAVS